MSIDVHPHKNSVTLDVPQSEFLSRGQTKEVSRVGSWWRRGLLAAIVVATVIGATAYIRGGVSHQPSGSNLTHLVRRGELVVSIAEEGNLESSSNREIKCRVRGGSTVLWIIKAGTHVNPGDELVRLDTKTIDDNINAQRIKYQNALALHAQSESDVAVARINVLEYVEGTYRVDKQTLQRDIKVAKSEVSAAIEQISYSRRLSRLGYLTQVQMDLAEEEADQKKMEVEVLETQLEILERYTKAKKIEELGGILRAKEAKLASDKASLDLEKERLDREEDQLKRCVIVAEVNGMVIYPVTEQWKNQPNIEEGATVREDQVLLVIPDLDQMQVKLGIHEAYVDRVKAGMVARVKLQDEFVDGEVISVASVTRPPGWWNGNQVKYDTIIKLNSEKGLKPGMTASAELFLARYDDVLTLPVAAVVEQEGTFSCWVRNEDGTRHRSIEVGDSNDQFIVVKTGVKEGEEVVLNPRAYIREAQLDALKPDSGDRAAKSGKETKNK